MGIDGSLVCTGIVVIETGTGPLHDVIGFGVVSTKPDPKSRHVYAADKDGARIDQISDGLWALIDQHSPHLVAYEAPAGAMSASAAKALALAHGTVRTAVRARGRQPLTIQRSEGLCAAGLTKAAGKSDVVEWATRGWPAILSRCTTKPTREALADALTIAHAALGTPAASALRAMELASR